MAAMAEPAPAAAASLTAGTALIKSLAACNASTRSKTLKSLMSWLQLQHLDHPQPPLSDDDLKKLWKGLFYCVWHSDKAVNQSNLINRLSSLLLSLSQPLSLNYFSHFLLTLRREWPGIDRLRLDKFYLMIRVFVRRLFELLLENRWNLDVVEEYWGVLEERLFVCVDDDKSLGDGVAYHVVSLFCDEIKPFLPLKLEVLNVIFRPFVSVLGRTDNKVLLSKLKTDLFGYLIRSCRGLLVVKKLGEEVDDSDSRVLFGTIVVSMEFSARFYELGSSPDCVQGNRKFLFSLHEEFSKLEKELKSSGVEDVELPQLIPNSSEDLQGGKKKKEEEEDKGASKDKQGKKRRKNNNENLDLPKVSNVADEPDSPKIDNATLSNIQMQFEVVAAEAGLDQGVSSSLESSTLQGNTDVSKKRKRAKKANNGKVLVGSDVVEDDNSARTAEKSGKKVNFSMRNNLVWNPRNPLPPQSLRIPPSSTPRGSALKKGVLPGPVREMSTGVKMGKKKKVARSKSPAAKRLKKRKSSA